MIENFLKYFSDKSKNYIIFDIGSRDCLQSIEFYNNFPNAKIYAFECNPNTLDICRKNIENYKDRITLIEGAVCDYDGEIIFYPINQEKTITTWEDGNPGASSLFKSNGKYPIEFYVQDEINTKCHRLDTVMKIYDIDHVDIIWMDLQGAELLALKGLGLFIEKLKIVYTEVSHMAMYEGQVLFNELNDFMIANNFLLKNNLSISGWQEDAIYTKVEINLSDFEKKIYSQNGEDGITMKLIELIYHGNNDNKFYVEFGVENGNECNTKVLREKYNWNGLQMDGSDENDSINLRKEFITKENVVELFKKYNVPQNINVLCVDIDFNDFYCLKEILENYTCDIIICEYNATHLPYEDKIVIYDKNGRWDGTNYFGVSLLALDKLGKKYNYSLIYCDKRGVNSFFVHNDIIQSKNLQFENLGNITKIYRSAGYSSGPNGGHAQDPFNRPFITFEEAIQL